MTADTQSLPLQVALPHAQRVWIETPSFDFLFFILSPIAILPIVLPAFFISPRFALLFFMLSFPHYVSTFAFFFWDENKTRHATRWVAFFAGPVIIAVTYWALFYFHVPRVMQLVLFAWNIFHVGRQSCGILSIYRHRAGVFDPVQKDVTNAAILAGSFFLAFWNIDSHPQWGPLLNDISPRAISLTKVALGVIAGAAVIRMVTTLMQRKEPVGLPEALFAVTSFVIFTPYLFLHDSSLATAVMLLPHYLQYLGLVWLLHRRRFRSGAEGSPSQRVLQKISANTPLLLVVLAGIGVSFAAASVILRHVGQPTIFESLYLLLAFEHFYLDALFWAFRDRTVRNSIGPYLTRYEHPRAEVA